MSTISKPHTFSPNTTISSSQVNADFDTLYNDYNGNIDASNLATSAVSTAKIADSAVTTAKIADSNVTAAKINFGGAGAGIWWQEIGRTTLASAGDTITVSGLPARKYLMIIVAAQNTGGTINTAVRFNNDSGSNYARRISVSGGSDTTNASQSSLSMSSTDASPRMLVIYIVNIATNEKIIETQSVEQNTAGAGNVPTRIEGVGKWANTADQITRVDVINSGTGDYATGSEIVVLGHD